MLSRSFPCRALPVSGNLSIWAPDWSDFNTSEKAEESVFRKVIYRFAGTVMAMYKPWYQYFTFSSAYHNSICGQQGEGGDPVPLLCAGTPHLEHRVHRWSAQHRRDGGLLECVQRRATEMIRDAAAPYKDRLRELGCAAWRGEGCGRPESGLLYLRMG